MRAKLDKNSPTGRINVTASEALVQRVEEWRAKQRPIPNRAEAVRILIERALKAEEQSQGARSEAGKRHQGRDRS
jgi:metal-responsive CopG/Arc/MetJ family transcriptional regulator